MCSLTLILQTEGKRHIITISNSVLNDEKQPFITCSSFCLHVNDSKLKISFIVPGCPPMRASISL